MTQAQRADAPSLEMPVGLLATVSGPPSGNRMLAGSENLVDQTPVDISLGGIPAWIVGVPEAAEPTWVVAHEEGTLEAWRLRDGRAERVSLDVTSLPPGTPPLVHATAGEIAVVSPPADASPLTYPVGVGERIIYITKSGSLAIVDSGEAIELEIDALPDSRISVSRDDLVSVLAGATDRYPHGVLGDELEAGRIVVVDPVARTVVGEAVISAPSVIEGIAAPWLDANGDAVDELLVTVSNSEVGARLAIFDRNGALIAQGPPIGRANRWRNQLGAAPTGPNGEVEVIDVRVPHIGGVVEYFRIEGDELILHAQQSGYTSHVYGARNLDMAIAADVTGDGRVEILAPTQDLTALGILSRTEDGVEVVGELPLPGRLTSNVGVSTLADGGLAVAVGTSDGILRIYAEG